MASHAPPDGTGDDFFEQMLSMPLYGVATPGGGGGGEGSLVDMTLQHSSGHGGHVATSSVRGGGSRFPFLSGGVLPLGRMTAEDGGSGGNEGSLEAASAAAAAAAASSAKAGTPGSVAVAPHLAVPRPTVRAKRGQATNPHSIAERLRRERIAERMRALQELVPNCNKMDRAAMLDAIVDYVKFLRLQVKVLSMSRLGGAGAFSQLAADIPLPPLEGEATEDGSNQQVWVRWSTCDSVEEQVAMLMEDNVGAAMQFLQANALCIVPISLAASICQMRNQPGTPSTIKPDPGTLS